MSDNKKYRLGVLVARFQTSMIHAAHAILINYVRNNPVYIENEWEVVRNYDEFIELLQKNLIIGKYPHIVSFDHDLCDEHYQIGFQNNWKDFDYNTKEKTGLSCAVYLCDFIHYHQLNFPITLVHSMNPVGRKNISEYIKSFKRFHYGKD